MLHNRPEMPQHILLAFDRHACLLEEAKRQRQLMAARKATRPSRRWRWLRLHLGELLITVGQRLKADAVPG